MSTTGRVISEIWLFVVVDPETHDEGLLAVKGPNGTEPLVAGDQATLEHHKLIAALIAEQDGSTVLVKHLTNGTTVDTICPGDNHAGLRDRRSNGS